MDVARRDLEAGQLAAALRRLSSWYDDPRLAPEPKSNSSTNCSTRSPAPSSTRRSTCSRLPTKCSRASGWKTSPSDYNVPWQLLAKINGIDDPQTLRAGERLKVMRGPFSAMISLESGSSRCWLGDGSYAGRFAIGVGREHPPRRGRVRRLR